MIALARKDSMPIGWRSSTVEQLICNQQVVGSSPIASSIESGRSIQVLTESVF